MNTFLLSRLGLPLSCLLVFVPVGHVGLPIGIGFLRFVNPRYSAEPIDWIILGLFVVGTCLAILSYWRDGRLLLACSIVSLAAVIAIVYYAWASQTSISLLITAMPFAAISIWSLAHRNSHPPPQRAEDGSP